MPFWRSGALGALAFGVSAAIAISAVAACSQAYGEESKPGGPDDDASVVDAAVGADGDATTTADVGPVPAPTFTVLASGRKDLGGIAATDTTVYFTEPAAGTVSSVPVAGGTVGSVGKDGAPGPITVAGGYLFWSDVGASTLTRQPLGTTQPTTFPLTPGKAPSALAASADRLVVLRSALGNGEVQQFPFDLGSLTSITGLTDPFDVAVAGSDIYWTEPGAARIGKGAINTSTNVELSAAEQGCESIAANAKGVYWTVPTTGLVRTTALAGANGPASLAEKEVSPSSIAVDETDVYWLTGDGTLRRKTIGQELPPATLATGFKSVFAGTRIRAIALTSKYVVWLTSDGRVLRIEK